MAKGNFCINCIEKYANRYATHVINHDPIVSHFKDELDKRFLTIIARFDDTDRVYARTRVFHLRTTEKESYVIILNATYFKTLKNEKDDDEFEYEIERSINHELLHMCQFLYIWRLYDYNEKSIEVKRELAKFRCKKNKHKTKLEILPRMFEEEILVEYNDFIEYMHEALENLED